MTIDNRGGMSGGVARAGRGLEQSGLPSANARNAGEFLSGILRDALSALLRMRSHVT